MVNYIFQVETSIKETLFRIKEKDMDKCSGLIQAFIKVNGKMVLRMEKDKYILQEEIL